MVNSQHPKRNDMRQEHANVPQLSAVVTIHADSRPAPTKSAAHQQYSGLSWEQAIYKFPTENVAIMDEDGQIVSANNCWLAASEGAQGAISSTPGIAVNYFEFLRFALPSSEAQKVITNLQQLVRGERPHVVANCVFDGIDRRSEGDIVAYRLIDSPNTLVIIHSFYRLD